MPSETSKTASHFRLRPKQKTFVENTAMFSFYVGGLGAGKALALDTPIPTLTGWTTMGELRVGDTVFDEQGQPCRVTFTTDVMYDHPCYEVVFSDGERIVADAEHNWNTETYLARKRARRNHLPVVINTITTEKIRSSLYHGANRNHAIRVAMPLECERKDLPIDPYALGVWLGDGTATTAQITSVDEPIIQELVAAGYIARRVPSVIGAPQYTIGSSEPVRCTTAGRMLSNDSLRSKLRALGVLGNKHVPAIYLRGSSQQRTALLQGLMDTDGTIDKYGKCEFYSTNIHLANAVYELCVSLGVKATQSKKRSLFNGKEYKTCYRIRFTAYFPVFRLPRKLERQKKAGNQASRQSLRYIVDVSPVVSVPVRCIQVDSPSHLYLASRAMIPNHNTFAGVVRSLVFITKYPGSLGLIGAPTFPMLRDTTMRTFFEWCPDALLKSYNKNEMKAVFVNGSEVLFRSMDDPDKARGINLSWFWLDEAPFCGYYAWKVLKARAGRQDPKKYPRAGWATGTPKGKDGFWEDFEHKPQPDHFLVRASTYENAVNLPDGYADTLGYEGAFKLQEIEGRFEAFEGLVYQFNAEPVPGSHIMPNNLAFRTPSGHYLLPEYDDLGQRVGWKRVVIHRKDRGGIEYTKNDAGEEIEFTGVPRPLRLVQFTRILGGVDWGFTNPAVGVVLGVDRDDRVYQVFEFYQRRASREKVFYPALVDMARTFEIETFYCDPAEPQSIIELRQKFDEEEVPTNVRPGDNEIIVGIHTVRSFLAMRDDGMPGFLLDGDLCKNTKNEFGSYQYATKEQRDRNPTELPIPQNDHALGSVRYALHTAMGVGRTGFVATAASHSEGDDLQKAEKALEIEDELTVIRGRAASQFLRELDKRGLVEDGLFRPGSEPFRWRD